MKKLLYIIAITETKLANDQLLATLTFILIAIQKLVVYIKNSLTYTINKRTTFKPAFR